MAHASSLCCSLAVLMAVAVFVPLPAQGAVSTSCADLRTKIIDMESEVPSGAALSVDLQLRDTYTNDCLKHPSDGQTPGSAASDPWFDAKGDPASAPPPDGNGVYQTTPQIAGYCQGSSEPQLCALMLNIGEGRMLTEGGDPQDPNDWVAPKRDTDPADALPPLQLSVGGQTFPIDDACLPGLGGLLFATSSTRGTLADNLRRSSACGDELIAIQPALGALRDAMAQWYAAALSDPVMRHDAEGKLQPAFRAMCSKAFANQNTCLKSQMNMSTAGADSGLGTHGQAGTFGECASLYGSVVAMCKQAGLSFPETPRAAGLSPPAANKPPLNKLPPPKRGPMSPNDTTGGSSAPPLNDKCRELVQNLVSSAKANDGPGAKAGYDALQQAGGCGVLPGNAAAAAPQPDPRFASRGDTPMLDQTFGACDQQPERCNQLANQLKAGTSPAAIAALYANAIGVGLQLSAEMAQGLAAAQQMNAPHMPSSSTNYNSLAGPIIRNGVGQGAPTARAPSPPKTYQSCGAGPVCSAQ